MKHTYIHYLTTKINNMKYFTYILSWILPISLICITFIAIPILPEALATILGIFNLFNIFYLIDNRDNIDKNIQEFFKLITNINYDNS